METLCPSVESNSEAVHDELTLGGILRVFLPVLLHLLKLSAHKLRVLWQLAACGTHLGALSGPRILPAPSNSLECRWTSARTSTHWARHSGKC